MNKTLTITVIALVAVVMGFSAVAPAIPMAYSHVSGAPHLDGVCPEDTEKLRWVISSDPGNPRDKNGDTFVCIGILKTPSEAVIIIDNSIPIGIRE